MDYFIRHAAGAELGDALALMPHMAAAGVSPGAVLVARSLDADALLGVATFSTNPSDTRLSGVRGDIMVLPSQRRRGIASALLKALAQELLRWDIPYLHGWEAYAAGGETCFLLRNGFQPLRPIQYFQVEGAVLARVCGAMLARLARSGRVPANLELLPLAASAFRDAAELYAGHFSMSLEQASARLQQGLQGPARDLSCQLRDGDKLLGFILMALPEGEPPTVDLWISAPAYRTGWPAMMLLEKSVRRGLELGYTHAKFHCNDEARATLNIARMTNAILVQEKSTWALDVAKALA